MGMLRRGTATGIRSAGRDSPRKSVEHAPYNRARMLWARVAWSAVIGAIVSASVSAAAFQRVSTPAPHVPATRVAGFDLARLADIDAVVNDAIAAQQLPGAVVLVGRGDTSSGARPTATARSCRRAEPMTLDTIFDLASLTKVVATTPAGDEAGRGRPDPPHRSRRARSSRSSANYGKDAITIRDLLTHMSGLAARSRSRRRLDGLRRRRSSCAIEEMPTAAPGRRFVYSDINFFLLGEIVARVSKQPLDEFVRDATIFAPLGMTRDDVSAAARARCRGSRRRRRATRSGALHDRCGQPPLPAMLRGVVHDPTARRMGGVAGHAGSVQHGGRPRDLLPHAARRRRDRRGARPVAAHGRAHDVARDAGRRAERARARAGISTRRTRPIAASCCRSGRSATRASPGTSIWIDPATRVFIVFLSNRVHPDGTGDVTPLRAEVATIVAVVARPACRATRAARCAFSRQTLGVAATPAAGGRRPRRRPGIDVLRATGSPRSRACASAC